MPVNERLPKIPRSSTSRFRVTSQTRQGLADAVLVGTDGPDEVHRILIAKNILGRYHAGEGWYSGT